MIKHKYRGKYIVWEFEENGEMCDECVISQRKEANRDV